jgi:hypothetical protein
MGAEQSTPEIPKSFTCKDCGTECAIPEVCACSLLPSLRPEPLALSPCEHPSYLLGCIRVALPGSSLLASGAPERSGENQM